MKVRLKTGVSIVTNNVQLYSRNNIEYVSFIDLFDEESYNLPKSDVKSIELL